MEEYKNLQEMVEVKGIEAEFYMEEGISIRPFYWIEELVPLASREKSHYV